MSLLLAAIAALLLQGENPAPATIPTAAPPAAQDDPVKPPPESAQETPSKALDDLLRRLAEERGAPSLVPPSPNEPAPPEGALPIDPALRRARLTRVSDAVEVLTADRRRRDLEFWDKHFELEVGDEVRQSSRSCTLLDFGDGANFRFDGIAVWRMDSDALATPRLFAITTLGRRAELHLGRGGMDTAVTLPGGNELAGQDARVVVRNHDLRALEVSNSGPAPVVVRSPYLGAEVIALEPGQRIFLPVLSEPSARLPHLTHDLSLFDATRGTLRVEAQEEVRLAVAGDAIEAAAVGPVFGIARACGARVVLQPGESIKLTRAPLGFPRRREWDE